MLVDNLKVAVNAFIAITNAGRELDVLKAEHNQTPLTPQVLQQRTASVLHNLEDDLKQQGLKLNSTMSPKLTRAINDINNNITSFQRHMLSKISGVRISSPEQSLIDKAQHTLSA